MATAAWQRVTVSTKLNCCSRTVAAAAHPGSGRPLSSSSEEQAQAQTRRVALAAAVGLLALPRAALAAPAADPPAAWAAAGLRPALTAADYTRRILSSRRPAIHHLQDLLGEGKFNNAAASLLVDPFDGVYQASRYLPL
jgi:hypothetical protein